MTAHLKENKQHHARVHAKHQPQPWAYSSPACPVMYASSGPAVAGHPCAEGTGQVQEQQLGSEQQPQPACKAALIALPNTVVDGRTVVVKGFYAPAASR